MIEALFDCVRVSLRHMRFALIHIAVLTVSLGTSTTIYAQSVERQLMVSALDEAGKPVAGLEPTDFLIREDGSTREVLSVGPNTEARQIAVLVDTSQAANSSIADFRQAVDHFVKEMYEGNQISIIGIGGPPQTIVKSTGDLAQLQKGANRIVAFTGSAMYLLDAVSDATQRFQRLGSAHPVIVVLATNGPDYSNIKAKEALRNLDQAGVSFYTALLKIRRPRFARVHDRNQVMSRRGDFSRFSLDEPFRQQREERDVLLDRGPANSGGRRFDLFASRATAQALREVAAELRGQYMVTYASPDTLIPPKHIEVTVTQKDVTASGTPVKDDQ